MTRTQSLAKMFAASLIVAAGVVTMMPTEAMARSTRNQQQENTTRDQQKENTNRPSQPNNNQKQDQPSTTVQQTSASSLSQSACSLQDVSNTAGTLFATACDGPNAGNDTGAQGTGLQELSSSFSSLLGAGSWSLGGKSDDGSNSFGFFAQNNQSTGSFGFANPFSGTFAVSLKAGNAYSLYLFRDVTNFTTGMFNTIGVERNGSGNAGRDLSHASLFVFNPTETPGNNGGGGGQPVPEPFTILGTLAAAGMGYRLKRQRDQANQA